MLFLRSIRRRLVTGFTVALGFMLLMTAAAIWGLARHQQAINDIEYLVHESPDRAKLESNIYLIIQPLEEAARALNAEQADLSQKETIFGLRSRYLRNVQNAQTEAAEFWKRSEKLAAEDARKQSLGIARRRNILQTNMRQVTEKLRVLESYTAEIDSFATTSREQHMENLQRTAFNTFQVISDITANLKKLPEWNKEQHVLANLVAEQHQSTLLLRRVLILAAITLLSYAITIYCGFRWISNPLRAIASGASRIANGDTRFRLGPVTPWKDEFFDLVENFNRMADRFQESEDDLSAKVEERSRQLVRSERLASVGILAAGLAHEINNPLQSITIASESLQLRLYDQLDPDHADTVEALERLAMIQRESKRCGEITKRLLNFSRSDSSDDSESSQLATAPEDLTRIICEVIAMVRPMRDYADREIVFDRADPLFVEVNAAQIKQVILNLVVNGLQATEANGQIDVQVKDQTDWVVIDIHDNGHGMTLRNIEQLFEPFYSTKETGQGTGLGLSITHRIIEDHHGTIDPTSAGPGQGSTFSIRLPRRQPAQRAA